ncbi:MAG: sigma-70 family RNA polymerase sigma factor [Planctomycetota bacterium]
MLNYHSSDLAQLAHQLTLAPRRLRLKQLEGIESLLVMIEPDVAYPYELVCYTITGYRPRKPERRPPLLGKTLIADLVTMADHLSRRARLTQAELTEPFRTHEELADALKVSTKTIRRWRCRGLTGLRVVFDDGVGRTVFLRKTAERFVRRNADLVQRGAAFKQLSAAEKDKIVELAREMLGQRRMKLHVVARAIAARTGRAVETVRYTLRRYDQNHPAQALFAHDGQPVISERHRLILRCHQAGDTAAQIAAVLGCEAAEVEHAFREAEARRLKELRLECAYNELFDAPNADALILHAPEPPADGQMKKVRPPKDLPPYLRALYDIPLLSPAQERDQFRRYNYLKYKAARFLEVLDPLNVTDAELAEIHTLLARIEALKKGLVSANLRLVVSIAKRHVGSARNFFEVVSDGNLSLMRAVEKFDYARGNKFSTYASWAIMKNFARTIPEEHYHCRQFVTGQDGLLGCTADHRAVPASPTDLEGVRAALAAGLSELTERERTIVTQHYGLFGQGPSQTLEQLGRRFGVTKERIRQIEGRALNKIRHSLAPTAAELVAD